MTTKLPLAPIIYDDFIDMWDTHIIEVASLRGHPIGVVELEQDGYGGLGPIPPSVPDGVYTLFIETHCGCFMAKIYLKRCHAPTMPTEFYSTDPLNHAAQPEALPTQDCDGSGPSGPSQPY